MTQILFLLAYACSGLAGLVYEVSWTRLMTLEMGRGTAASSTVLAAFMGGLALGAALAGRWAGRLSASRALRVYAALELSVAVLAVALPFELRALTPVFAAAYRDGAGGMTFGLVRLVASLALLLLPAMALGATFPVAIRWFASERQQASRLAGRLYAANTVGAAVGSALAGFILLPAIGVFGTLMTGAAASLAAAAAALVLATKQTAIDAAITTHAPTTEQSARPARAQGKSRSERSRPERARSVVHPEERPRPSLAAALLAITGAATFSAEVAWTRVFSLLIGPSTYAFAATVATFVAGLAIGATIASLVSARTRHPAAVAALCFALASVASVWATNAAGTSLPREVALEFVTSPDVSIVARGLRLAVVILPMAIAIGAAFPIALQLASDAHASPLTLGLVYAVNTIAGVCGSLLTGFVLIPMFGLEHTLTMVAGLLAAGALVAALGSRTSALVRGLVVAPLAAALLMFVGRGPWDRDLLASGAYKYASAIAPGLDVESALTFGTLVYYRDGATATVSVKRLTGALSLAIDGKVDASTGGDMLTQKLLAHLPLLLHGDAKDVCIIGLGSGITVASALTHGVTDVDVLEISPEVAEASRLFAQDGKSPLDDPRTRLLVADGRTHLALSDRTYDVIVAEPSNPWMAGVAALFTREFFESARLRLSDHGVICQWVNTYDISPDDLKSVVATFTSVFPHATLWLAGDGDLLLLGSTDPMEPRIDHLAERWAAGAASTDLKTVGVMSSFELLSMFVAGEEGAARFGSGAALQTDDKMALEFSAPRALHTASQKDNVRTLRSLEPLDRRPAAVVRAWAQATGEDHAHRSAIFRRAGAFEAAYDAARTAIEKAPGSSDALQALVEASAPLARQSDAVALLTSTVSSHPELVAPRVALSRLHASMGAIDAAIADVSGIASQRPDESAALEQLASIFADVGDAGRLGAVVTALSRHPERSGTAYYTAAHHFLRGELEPALAAAQRAVSLDPRFARAQNLVGAIYATRGDAASARKAFEASLVLDSQDPATYQNLALLELNTGNAASAARLFGEALSLDPSSDGARQGLARARAAL
ncbi:MAG: fused MFS/spermidine synthase [Vicinamibacterales bacterium]